MKKPIVLICIIILLLSSACGSQQKDVDVKVVAKSIIDELNIEQMSEVDADTIEFMYDNLEVDDLLGYCVYSCGTASSFDEIVLIKVKDDDQGKKVYDIIKERKNDRYSVYKDYSPLQADKIERSIVVQDGQYVYWLACNNPEDAQKIIKEAIK